MIGGIIQAHMGSTRLPGKVLKDLAGKPMLFHDVERMRHTAADIVIVATSISPADDAIEMFCKENGYDCFRGSDADVLSRYYEAARQYGLGAVVRVTSDCPLIDPVTADRVIEAFKRVDKCDYASNYRNDPIPGDPAFPHGLELEMFSFKSLEIAQREATDPHEREHVEYIWKNTNGVFKIGPVVPVPPEYVRPYRLTVDYPEDFALMQKIYEALYRPGKIIAVLDALLYLDEHPDVAALNSSRSQKQTA